MNLQPFEMPRHEARKAFLSYRESLRNRHSAEEEAIMRGYKAVADGKTVIYLPTVMKAGGLDDAGYPRLAIVKADATRVRCRIGNYWRGEWKEADAAFWDEARDVNRAHPIIVPRGTFPVWNGKERKSEVRAIVPIVPPQLRPAAALSNYHILFEAEWRPIAPKDPALLKDLGGGLYAVLAVWDLTELERAVLGITRRQV